MGNPNDWKGIGMIEVGNRAYSTKAHADELWQQVEPRLRPLVGPRQLSSARGRLKKWVTESRDGNVFTGRKGRFYRHASVDELAMMLAGRLNEGAAKDIERRLAERIHSSNAIKDQMGQIYVKLRDRINAFGEPVLSQWRERLTNHRTRYGYFYGTKYFNPRGNKNVWEALQRLTTKWNNAPSCTITAAWLCDFALAQRGLTNGSTGRLPFMEQLSDTSNIPNPLRLRDQRAPRYNANEADAWVQAARRNGVRIGAGASNTTGQVISCVDHHLSATEGYDKNSDMVAIGLSLFAFWNRHRKKLQASSEIHTYHEVMHVLRFFGVDHVVMPAFEIGEGTVYAPQDAHFEYPDLAEIP